MVRKLYQVRWNMRSGYWPEPLTAGDVVQLPVPVADMLNRCSPGVLVEWEPPKAAEAPAKAPEPIEATDAPVEVKRGPGRPPKTAAPLHATRDR